MLRKQSGVSLLVLLVTLTINAKVFGTGLMSCDAGPRDSWGSKQALRSKLTAEGWVVRKIKVDAGCYEVYGTTPDKKRVEAYFDPVRFEKLLVARRGEILFRRQVE